MSKALLILILTLGTFNCVAQNQRVKEEQTRSNIDVEFEQNYLNCSCDVDAVTDFNGKTEFWKICELKNGNRILVVESHEKEIYYREIYFEKNGDLIYANETENYMPTNHFTQMSWSCHFYAENGKLISMISLGHGKTEDEEWDPNVIFEMFEKRKEELKRIKR